MSTLVVYTRPGCHLCEQALAQLRPLAVELSLRVQERDIEADEQTFKRYLERIPVGILDGEHLFDYFVDEAQLRARLGKVGESN